jgi:hypothetical protein
MPQLSKRPIVIQDLIEISTYISYDNLDAGDRGASNACGREQFAG